MVHASGEQIRPGGRKGDDGRGAAVVEEEEVRAALHRLDTSGETGQYGCPPRLLGVAGQQRPQGGGFGGVETYQAVPAP
ncbi:hypothetical protein [Streptomyces sp. RKCA744]|uniref:hypothetical protein n=1 Tax=Streptomyces sp. RKCA744 TaxID=2959340 RepID=UPI0035AB930C